VAGTVSPRVSSRSLSTKYAGIAIIHVDEDDEIDEEVNT
jgi:hypothetical protein